MALSDASGDPLAHSNGGHHHLTSANASTPASDGQDPLMPTPDADLNLTVCTVQQKPQRLHGIQKTNRSNQGLNGSVVKQNGSLRNLPSPSTVISSPATITDSQRLTQCHVPSSPSPPGLCCQHCHLHSTLACPCGQQECPSTGPRSGCVPHHSSASAPPCCLSTCTYAHHQSHPSHPTAPLCLQHHHHHQRWQDHLQNQTPGIRYVGTAVTPALLFCVI